MAGLVNVDLSGVIKAGGNIIDDLWTSKEEEMAMDLQGKKIDADLQTGQMKVNQAEASHKSMFVAGWRPFIGWVGGFALGYKFLFYPFLIWIWTICQAMEWIPPTVKAPPTLNAGELYPIILGMLGLGGMRTAEGLRGVKSENMGQAIKQAQEKKKTGFKWPWKK